MSSRPWPVATVLVVLAALAVVLSHDLRSWRTALRDGDARYAQTPAAARWSPSTLLPASVSGDLLGVDDDVAARRAIRLFRIADRARGGLDTALERQGTRAPRGARARAARTRRRSRGRIPGERSARRPRVRGLRRGWRARRRPGGPGRLRVRRGGSPRSGERGGEGQPSSSCSVSSRRTGSGPARARRPVGRGRGGAEREQACRGRATDGGRLARAAHAPRCARGSRRAPRRRRVRRRCAAGGRGSDGPSPGRAIRFGSCRARRVGRRRPARRARRGAAGLGGARRAPGTRRRAGRHPARHVALDARLGGPWRAHAPRPREASGDSHPARPAGRRGRSRDAHRPCAPGIPAQRERRELRSDGSPSDRHRAASARHLRRDSHDARGTRSGSRQRDVRPRGAQASARRADRR